MRSLIGALPRDMSSLTYISLVWIFVTVTCEFTLYAPFFWKAVLRVSPYYDTPSFKYYLVII